MIPCNPIVDMRPGEGNTNSWFRLIQKGAAMEKKTNAEASSATPEQIALAKSLSPISFINSASAPAFLMHGLDDTIVPASGTQRFADALRESGVPVDLILIPGARHAFILPKYTATEQQVVDAMLAVDRFLIRYGYLSGDTTLKVSTAPAWIPKSRATPKSSASPTSH